tara:strand:- start:254 stop:451 length:198 start_codon:yes stop_codon:yes gene_type:complete
LAVLDGLDQRIRVNVEIGNDIVAKENKDFEIEESLAYKNPDGSRGWILRIKPKPKSKEENERKTG